jgi:hypothetical protein
VLWADDRVLRDLAWQSGVRSFGTSDLVVALTTRGGLSADVAAVVRAILVANRFVGQAISTEDFISAGDLVGWQGDSLSCSLRFGDFMTVEDRLECFERALDSAVEHPELLGRLSYSFATWVLGTPVNESMRDGLLTATMTSVLARPWLDAGRLPFILDGVRTAYSEHGQALAPLEGAVRNHFDLLTRSSDVATAAVHLRGLFSLTQPEDRYVVTEVTLTSGLRGHR